MKRLLALLIFIVLGASSIYADEVIEDDSTPYMPYPERVEIIKTVPEPAPKTPAKQNTNTKKKTTTKKNTAKKKNTTKKAATPKKSSLERGIELMQAERYEAAKPYLLKAIQENRNNPNAWYWYGVYHEKTGKFSQAQYFFSKALAIDPALEPLSRVVYYPNDNEKTPLWDPKRPARVYPVETKNNGVTIGKGNFPSAPNDPELPKVPVYTPPEPGANPMDGDSWSPALYVPPSPEEIEGTTVENELPVYNPPQPSNVEVPKNTNLSELYSYKIPGYSNTYADIENPNVRADLPLYNPPEPGKIVAQTPKQAASAKKEVKEEIKPAVAKNAVQTKSAPRKIVKKSGTSTQNQNNAKNVKKTTTPKTTSKKKETPKKEVKEVKKEVKEVKKETPTTQDKISTNTTKKQIATQATSKKQPDVQQTSQKKQTVTPVKPKTQAEVKQQETKTETKQSVKTNTQQAQTNKPKQEKRSEPTRIQPKVQPAQPTSSTSAA